LHTSFASSAPKPPLLLRREVGCRLGFGQETSTGSCGDAVVSDCSATLGVVCKTPPVDDDTRFIANDPGVVTRSGFHEIARAN